MSIERPLQFGAKGLRRNGRIARKQAEAAAAATVCVSDVRLRAPVLVTTLGHHVNAQPLEAAVANNWLLALKNACYFFNKKNNKVLPICGAL